MQRIIGVLGGAEYIEVWRWDHSTLLSVLFNEGSLVLVNTDMLKFVSTSVKTGHGWNHFRSNWRWILTILNTWRINKVKVVQCPPNWRMLQIKGDREQVLIALRFSHIFAPITAVVSLEFCTNEALDQNLQSLEDSKPGTLGCTKKHIFSKIKKVEPIKHQHGG